MSNSFIDLSPSKHLEALFDNGNYTEIGAHLSRLGGEPQGVVCGYGPVDGRLVFAFAQDETKMKGAFDSRSVKKIENLYSLALKSGAPVVGVFASSGSVVSEGAALLGGIGALFSAVARASGEIPQIALVAGTCTGSMSVAASMFDLAISVKDAEFSVSSKYISGGVCPASSGLSAIVAENEDELYATAKKLIAALPDSCDCIPSFENEAALNRPLSISEEDAKDADKLIAAFSDGEFVELYKSFGEGMKVGFAPIGGGHVGIVATDYSIGRGTVTPEGAKKAASFIDLCSDYSIPVITFINSDGLDASGKSDQGALASAAAELAKSYRYCDAPKISAVVGRACGAILPIMGSRAGASDVSFALEGAVISPMTPEASVAFLKNDQISDTTSRESLEAEFARNEAAAENAAEEGEIDFICEIGELRQRICGALMMLCPEC